MFGNLYGLVNMSLFLLLANYVAALVAVQLLRGDLGDDVTMNFGQIYTSFLAMYQVRALVIYRTFHSNIFRSLRKFLAAIEAITLDDLVEPT